MDLNQDVAEEEFMAAAYSLLPSTPSFTTYSGSLTTPPCSEVGVTFRVRSLL